MANEVKKVIDLSELLTAYGTYTLKAVATADGYEDSDPVTVPFMFGPRIAVKGGVLTITKCLDSVTQFEIYIDGEVVATVDYDHSDDWSLDLSTLKNDDEKHSIAVRAVGEGISTEHMSNTVTAYVTAESSIYGVSGMYSSTVALTRTDDAVGMSYTINSDGSINSDFDNAFPWNRTELVTDEFGNEFVEFPTMYFRVGIDSSKRITDIAVSGIEHEDGTWYKVDPFRFGRYAAYNNNGVMLSQRGYTRNTATRANWRTYATANGDGYQQLDLYHHTVLLFLWWIEWATKDSASVMTGCISGKGTTGGTSTMPCGGTDNVATPSGYELTRHQMRYHYIEDFVGNGVFFVDGIYRLGYGSTIYDYATADPSKFAYCESSSYASYLKKLGFPNPTSNSNQTIAAFGWDVNNPFLCGPTTTVTNSSYNTYFCDRDYHYSGGPCLYVGAVAANSYANYGVSYCYSYSSSSAAGGRLLYIP